MTGQSVCWNKRHSHKTFLCHQREQRPSVRLFLWECTLTTFRHSFRTWSLARPIPLATEAVSSSIAMMQSRLKPIFASSLFPSNLMPPNFGSMIPPSFSVLRESFQDSSLPMMPSSLFRRRSNSRDSKSSSSRQSPVLRIRAPAPFNDHSNFAEESVRERIHRKSFYQRFNSNEDV